MSLITPSSAISPLYVDELIEHVGDIPGARIRLNPAPGTATDADLLQICDHEDRLCELIDGILVDKTYDTLDSYLTAELCAHIGLYAREHDLGIVLGSSGPLRFTSQKIYLPDVSFISWSQNPMPELRKQPIADLHPDLAVEVLSPSNTAREMQNKRKDYFAWGVQLVWELDPVAKVMHVYSAPEEFTVVDIHGTLDGGNVLPGFTLTMATLFADLDRGQ